MAYGRAPNLPKPKVQPPKGSGRAVAVPLPLPPLRVAQAFLAAALRLPPVLPRVLPRDEDAALRQPPFGKGTATGFQVEAIAQSIPTPVRHAMMYFRVAAAL
jgi:hypothetical protein